MTNTNAGAAAIIPSLLRTLRLPTIGRLWEEQCQQATVAHWSHQCKGRTKIRPRGGAKQGHPGGVVAVA
jgi:hypothetical protein